MVQQRLLARLHESSPKSPEEKAADVEAAAKIAMVSRSVSPSSSHSSPQHRPNSHSNSPNVLRNELTEREKYIEEARFFGIHNNHRQSNMAPDKEDMYILHELSHANRYAADSPFFHKNVPPPPMAPSTPPVSNISKQTVSTLQSMINISKQQPSVADVSTLPPPLLPTPPPLPRPPSPPQHSCVRCLCGKGSLQAAVPVRCPKSRRALATGKAERAVAAKHTSPRAPPPP